MITFRQYIDQQIIETGMGMSVLQKKGRIDIFRKKMSDGTEFTSIKGDTFKIPNTEVNINTLSDIENSKGSRHKFLTDVIGPIPAGSILKTKEFGGGKGNGGGSKMTDITESAQCVYCSLAYNVIKSEITIDDITIENMEKAVKYVDITSPLSVIMDLDPKWVNSSLMITNVLYNQYKNTNVEFHRGSKFMKSIYKQKNKLMKDEMGSTLKDDKWNPGDIWMTTSKGSSTISKTYDSIGDFNQVIHDLFLSKDLIAISLKKAIKSATIQIYNIDYPVYDQKMDKYVVSSVNGFFNSIDTHLFSDKGDRIQLRAFSTTGSWLSEIKGKSAAGGKMGMGPINILLKSMKLDTIPTNISKIARNPNKKFYKEFYDLYKKHGQDKSVKNINDFIQRINDIGDVNDASWSFRYSKYLCLKFIEVVESSDKADEIIQGMLRYGSSSTLLSSVFIKVY